MTFNESIGFFVPDQADRRKEEIESAISRGENYAKIASYLGISRERVRQLVNKYGLPPGPATRSELGKVRDTKKALRARDIAAKRDLTDRLIKRVQAGETIYSIVKSGACARGFLDRRLKKAGVKSQHGWQRCRASSAGA